MVNNFSLPDDDKISTILTTTEGWLFEREAWCLYGYARQAITESDRTDFLIEIGSWAGRSTAVLALACKRMKKCQVLSVDPHATPHTPSSKVMFLRNMRKHKLLKQVVSVLKTSDDAYKKFADIRAGFLFIDGDHQYHQVQKDVWNWTKCVRPGGFVLLHDTINFYGPRKMVLRLLLSPYFEYIGNQTEVAVFKKSALIINPVHWARKIVSYVAFRLFFLFYKPDNS